MIQIDRVRAMHASIKTVAFRGIDTIPVEVQAHVANGLPAMAIVGLADKAVAESRERVRAALASIGLALPPKRIAINLAPADLVKEGAHYDLPIALGLLVAIRTVPADAVDGSFVLGELALHGGIEPVSGVLPAAMAAVGAGMDLICPQACGPEAAWASDLGIVAAPDLMSLLNHLRGIQMLEPPRPELLPPAHQAPDMSDLKGQETARPVQANRCLRRGFPVCFRPCLRVRHSMLRCFIRLPASFPPAGWFRHDRFVTRIILRRWPHLSVAVCGHARVRFLSPMAVFCFSTNSPNSPNQCLMRYASQLRPARSWSRVPTTMLPIPRNSSWLRR